MIDRAVNTIFLALAIFGLAVNAIGFILLLAGFVDLFV